MLNNKKQINSKNKNNISSLSFFNLPVLPVDSYLQSSSNVKNLIHLNLIFKDLTSKILVKNFRHHFCSKIYRTSSLLTKYLKKKRSKKKIKTFKNYLFFINHLCKKLKIYPNVMAKKIKGGFMTRSFGITTFMPRGHYLKKKRIKTKQVLLQVKACRRKKKYYSKKNWQFKINMVSSVKKAQKLFYTSRKI